MTFCIGRREFITLLGSAERGRYRQARSRRRSDFSTPGGPTRCIRLGRVSIPPGRGVHRPDSPRREASQPAGPSVHDLTCIHTLEVASLLARLAVGP
jgi:hypothetical protein